MYGMLSANCKRNAGATAPEVEFAHAVTHALWQRYKLIVFASGSVNLVVYSGRALRSDLC